MFKFKSIYPLIILGLLGILFIAGISSWITSCQSQKTAEQSDRVLLRQKETSNRRIHRNQRKRLRTNDRLDEQREVIRDNATPKEKKKRAVKNGLKALIDGL